MGLLGETLNGICHLIILLFLTVESLLCSYFVFCYIEVQYTETCWESQHWTMKADQARVRDLLTQTIMLMCKDGLEFSCNVRIEGLLAVTVDGTDIFVIHMDEKVTDQPAYAAASSHYTDSSIARPQQQLRQEQQQQRQQQQDSALDTDETRDSEFNDSSFLPPTSAVSDNERTESTSSAFHTTNMHSIKTEPNDDDDDSDDDVMIMESDIQSLMSSNIPLPVVEGMSEWQDTGISSYHLPLSPVSRKRTFHGRMSPGSLPASVGRMSDDQLADARHWSSSASGAHCSNNFRIPLTVFPPGDGDISHMMSHASFSSVAGPHSSVSYCCASDTHFK